MAILGLGNVSGYNSDGTPQYAAPVGSLGQLDNPLTTYKGGFTGLNAPQVFEGWNRNRWAINPATGKPEEIFRAWVPNPMAIGTGENGAGDNAATREHFWFASDPNRPKESFAAPYPTTSNNVFDNTILPGAVMALTGAAVGGLAAGAGAGSSAAAGGTAAEGGTGGVAAAGGGEGAGGAAAAGGAEGGATVGSTYAGASPAITGLASGGEPFVPVGMGAGDALTTPDWLPGLLSQTGEAGAGAGSLEGGFNAAAGGGGILDTLQGYAGSVTDFLNTPLGKIIGRVAPGLLGYLGSKRQSNQLTNIEGNLHAERAPFLNASTKYLNDPAAYFAGPGKAAMDATLRGLSVRGNPYGTPTSLEMANEAALRDWRNAVTGFGNLGLAGQDTRAQLLTNATNADANSLNAVGYGLGQVFNPQPTLADVVKELKGLGGGSSLA